MLIVLNTIALQDVQYAQVVQYVRNVVQIIISKLTNIAGLHAAIVLEHSLIPRHGIVIHALQDVLLAQIQLIVILVKLIIFL